MAKKNQITEPTNQNSIQLLNFAKLFFEFPKSDQYKNQTQGQDITSSNSSYQQNGETLDNAIKRLTKYSEIIVSKGIELDQWSGALRVNLNSYYQQINQYQGNLLSNYPGIISYADNILTQLTTYGINVNNELPSQSEIGSIKKELEKAKNLLDTSSDVYTILSKFQTLNNAEIRLQDAERIIEFANNTDKIKNVENLASKVQQEAELIEIYKKDFQDLIGAATEKTLSERFEKQAIQHRNNAKYWIVGIILSILFLIVLFIVSQVLFTGYIGAKFTIQLLKSYSWDFRLIIFFALLLLPICYLIYLTCSKYQEIQKIKSTQPHEDKKIGYDKNLSEQNIRFVNLVFFSLGVFFITFLICTNLTFQINLPIPEIQKIDFDTKTAQGLGLMILFRTTFLSPAIFCLTFSVRYFGRNNILAEEYEYKSISSSTFSTVLIKAKQYNPSLDLDQTTNNIVEKIYSFPRKNIAKYPHKDENLSELSTIEKIVEKAKNISDKLK